MMILKTIFSKALDRPIEGVIKADDEDSLRLEIEEYVLTNEIAGALEDFLSAYNNYTNANGVWISGFFGSGKSHLLKMLALVLENREIDNASAFELFLPKCNDNAFLSAELSQAVRIPSKSILFNIDQKADIISKSEMDALLAVFVKVFDEMCGYYGKQGHIAQFERELDSRGQYEKFQELYKDIAGKSWEIGREQAILETANIAKAYAEVTNSDEASAIGILDKYRSQFKVSIEDFAEQVNDYIMQQGENFRLNFFVDEVGQFIADNIKLMTNLQTIAESLATKCRGRAWIIVTAQEEMQTIVGEMDQQQGNDFSKIQARFANRMKLTSRDVAEVIQKRLLAKNEESLDSLEEVYNAQRNNFKTLFAFADGSKSFKDYEDLEHFNFSYPFVPYQFELFQAAIKNLSVHNAFEGKHSSVGERSMLGVFQQVAIQISEKRLGHLASFDLMFEGIRNSLKSNIQRAILQAENNLSNDFAVSLLKALFLVKYIKEFKPSIHNLCVLMLDKFDSDQAQLRKQIEEALLILEQQVYIQRNGDLYEYLTDEEKDIEHEIKNTDVANADIADELEKIVFDQIIKQRKIRYPENGQDYTFSRKLDDQLCGREYELTINLITPFHRYIDSEAMLLSNSNYQMDELFVVLPADDLLVRDLLMYKRTDKYIKQNHSTSQQETISRILNDKSFQNIERGARLQQDINNLLTQAKFYIAGNQLEINAENAQERVFRAFHHLIDRVYPNLRMLGKKVYNENMLSNILKNGQIILIDNDINTLTEAEQEVLSFIQRNNRESLRTTLKNLLDNFMSKPYGWYYAAVLCIIASLSARAKVELRCDGNILEGDELEKALRNTHGHGNVVLDPQIDFSASQVRALREFYGDFFDEVPNAGEAKVLGGDTGKKFHIFMHKLKGLSESITAYPFRDALQTALVKIQAFVGKPYTWYLTELNQYENELLDLKETLIDPVRKFMNSPHKDIFDNARNFVQDQNPNFSYLESSESEQILAILQDPNCFKGNEIQQLKKHSESLQNKINEQIEKEIAKAKGKIAQLKERISAMAEFQELDDDKQAQIIAVFNKFELEIKEQILIGLIRDKLRSFEDKEYPQLLIKLSEKQKPELTNEKQVKSVSYSLVNIRSLAVSYNKAWLDNEEDIEAYLQALREKMLVEVKAGKRIQV